MVQQQNGVTLVNCQRHFDSKKSGDHSMSVDELWALYEVVVAELGQKIAAECEVLEMRLRRLGAAPENPKPLNPKVVAEYRSPNNDTEAWTGRGKWLRWLRAEIRSGKKLTDFLSR
jgi:DNA-binding protein H-NS